MFLKEYFQIFMTLISIQEILTFSALDEDYIKDFIKSRKLREAGFNDFNLTSMLDTSIHDGLSISIDAASIHRRQRSAEKLDHYDVVINGFGESYRMTLKHTTSVLHPSATILTIDDDGETQWQGEHPNCFLIGDVHSHNGSVSASFCNELAGIMATDEHELYFEVLPHHIRRRSTIKLLKHTALLARKIQDRSKLASLKLENDYVNIDKGDTNVHKRRKRSVPSTSFTIEMAVYCDADFMTNHLHPTSTSDRVAAMVVKYNAVAFEWGRSDVLGYTITLSLKLLTFYDTNPSWYNTSTNLGVPLNSICTGTKNGLAYDHVHLHTGVKNPSLGGVAFQSRVCSVSLRCGVSSDGVTTYVTTAHEIGHNMGMLHDGDRGCSSPNVGVMGGAGVGWSTCSKNDMDTMLQTGKHNCLWEENISDSEIDPVELKTVTLEPYLPGQYLTNDEICEKMYGSGFHYREYPHLIQTICNIYSCVDLNTNQNSVKTYGRMYKQSQSIAGSYCADNKICFDGSCQPWSAAQITNPEVRAGAWSGWGSWTTCSRTCGRGMSFRKRKCDNPTPKNHAPCEGNEHDAEGCNVTSCAGDSPKDSELIKQRATETCAYLINNNIISGTFYTTEGQIYSSFKHGVCEVECTAVDGYTIPSFTRFGLIEHGTPCPGTLDNPDSHNYPRRPGFYWACLEGYCQKFDCANTLNSRVYDGCGVCNGNNDTCVIRTGTMSDAITIWTRTEMTTIPVGAYNIEMSFVWNNNRKYYIEIYTKKGTKIIASSSSAGDPARIFETGDNPISYGGTLWHFEYLTQIMYAKGPLDTPVVVKIYNYGSSVANTGVHYFYSVPLNIASCTGTCENGGTWNVNSCACDCQSGFTGTYCGSQCTSSTLCKNGASRHESTCECMCNEKQYGSTCDCRYPFKGGNCDTCKYYICENGGTFNATTCRCKCLTGYGGLKCEAMCADITDSATCATQAATGNCTSDNVNMEQNCMASCDLCVPVICSDAQMKCSVDNKCISFSNKCNGVEDCSDGSDESCSWLNSTGNSFQAIYGTIIAATIIWLLKSLLEY